MASVESKKDFEFICSMIEQYVIGHKLGILDVERMMLRNGITEDEYLKFVKAIKGGTQWPEFVISVVKNSNAVLA